MFPVATGSHHCLSETNEDSLLYGSITDMFYVTSSRVSYPAKTVCPTFPPFPINNRIHVFLRRDSCCCWSRPSKSFSTRPTQTSRKRGLSVWPSFNTSRVKIPHVRFHQYNYNEYQIAWLSAHKKINWKKLNIFDSLASPHETFFVTLFRT